MSPIAVILIIVGWVIVHFLSSRRDRDRIRREALHESILFLHQSSTHVLESAVKYHTSQRDEYVEKQLILEFTQMSLRAQQLSLVVGLADNYHYNTTGDSRIAEYLREACGKATSVLNWARKFCGRRTTEFLASQLNYMTSSLIKFKQACTGVHFSDEHDGQLSLSDDVLTMIYINEGALEQAILSIEQYRYV